MVVYLYLTIRRFQDIQGFFLARQGEICYRNCVQCHESSALSNKTLAEHLDLTPEVADTDLVESHLGEHHRAARRNFRTCWSYKICRNDANSSLDNHHVLDVLELCAAGKRMRIKSRQDQLVVLKSSRKPDLYATDERSSSQHCGSSVRGCEGFDDD